MKKLLSCLLTASMTVMMLPVQAHAETITENNLVYEVFDESRYELTGIQDKTVTSVTIPAELNDMKIIINYNIFADCPNLTEINVTGESETITSIDGVLFMDDTKLLAYPCAKADENYTIPNGTTEIITQAFSNCSHLKSVTFPDSLTAGNTGMFDYCPALEEIHGVIQNVGDKGAKNCKNLKYVEFDGGEIYLSVYPLLEYAKISNNTGRSYLSSNISSNPELKELFLPSVSAEFQIEHLQKLEILHFYNTPYNPDFFTYEFEECAVSDCPNLKKIIIEHEPDCSTELPLTLIGLPALESVIFYEPQTFAKNESAQKALQELKRNSIETVEIPKVLKRMFCNNFTVYGYSENQFLQAYCEKYNIRFSALDYQTGDVTGDSKADILDVVTINKAVLGKEFLTSEQVKAIDFNGNGKPDASDSLTLMKYIVGLIETLI